MASEWFYLLKVAPAVLTAGLGALVLGFLVGFIVFSGQKRPRRRLKRQVSSLRHDIRNLRQMETEA